MLILNRLHFQNVSRCLLVTLFVFVSGFLSARELDLATVRKEASVILEESKEPVISLIYYFRTISKEDFKDREGWLKSLEHIEKIAADRSSDYYAQLCYEIAERLYLDHFEQESFYYISKASTAIKAQPPHDQRFYENFHETYGLLYLYFKRFDDARNEFLTSLKLNKDDEKERIDLLNTLGLINRDQGYADSSRIYFEQALEIANRIPHKPWIGVLSGNLGNYYYQQSDFKKARSLAELDYKISMETNQLGSAAGALQLLIDVDLQFGQIAEAKRKLATLDSLVLSKPYSIRDYVSWYSSRTAVLEKEGKFREALETYRIAVQYRDTLKRRSDSENIRKTQFQVNFEREQAQVSLLKEKEKINSLKVYGLVLITVIVLVISVLMLRSASRRRKREKELASLKHAAISRELHDTEKEMRKMLSNLIEKNELIETLSSEIEDFQANGNAEQLEEKIKLLDRLQSFTLLTDDDWLVFKKLFEKLNPGFFAKVRSHFPDLTNAEIRLTALIKLNLSNLEMSRVLGISPDSVRKSGLRLRKKIDMEHHEDLVKFIVAL